MSRNPIARFIPKNAEQIRIEGLDDSQGVAYVSPCGDTCGTTGWWAARVFRGKATKPVERFRWAGRQIAIDRAVEQLTNIRCSVESKSARKAEALAKKATLVGIEVAPVGSIFVRSWGHDQTNVDALQVIGHFGRLGVVVRKISTLSTEAIKPLAMSCHVKPVKDDFCGTAGEQRAQIKSDDQIILKGHKYTRWNGDRAYYCSWYG